MRSVLPNLAVWSSNMGFSQLRLSLPVGVQDHPLLESLSLAQLNWYGFIVTQQVIESAIRKGQHAVAIDQMKTMLFSYSSTLAESFGKTFDHPSSTGLLIQKLRDDAVLSEEEWNRLTILLMVLDGLDLEIGEYGGELDLEDTEYLWEYCQIVEKVMSRHDRLMIIDYTATPEHTNNQQASWIQTETASVDITVVDTRSATNFLGVV